MLSRKRILRLAEKYGPFVRFYPGGSEEADDLEDAEPPASKVSDAEAAAAAIAEAEPKVEESPEFKGLLRDKQAAVANVSHLSAENAAIRQQNEALQKQIEDGKKTGDELPELSEEEAAEGVTRGELRKILRDTTTGLGKNVIENVTKLLDVRDTKTNQTNLAKNQAADASALKKTHTSKIKGQTLDAKTVVGETHAFLAANQPDLLEFLSRQPNFATLLYQLGTGEPLVPSVGKRVTLRRNTILAKQLDQQGDDVPGGGSPSSDELSVIEAIIKSGGDMTDEALEKYYPIEN